VVARTGQLLALLGLTSFVKTSGQSGLHILIALGEAPAKDADNDVFARVLVELLATCIAHEFPTVATVERRIEARGQRVFLDCGQSGLRRALAVPYSVRATEDACFSMPLRWDEVTATLDPTVFRLRSPWAAARSAWPADFWQTRPRLDEALVVLEQLAHKYLK
jgi:bifunctional non-homologous end joining protein LigD